MPARKHTPHIELEEDLEYQRREWRVERMGWVVMGLIVLLALLGALGSSGPLSTATTTGNDGAMSLKHNRFVHWQAPTRLEFELASAASQGQETAGVWLSRQFVEAVEITGIEPEPEQTSTGPDRFTYTFQVAQPGQPASVVFISSRSRSVRCRERRARARAPGCASATSSIRDWQPEVLWTRFYARSSSTFSC